MFSRGIEGCFRLALDDANILEPALSRLGMTNYDQVGGGVSCIALLNFVLISRTLVQCHIYFQFVQRNTWSSKHLMQLLQCHALDYNMNMANLLNTLECIPVPKPN